MKLELSTPVSEMSRIGKTTASRLKKLGIETASDLIFYYPFRWEDLSQVFNIADLQSGQTATIKVQLEQIKSRRSPVKKRLLTEGLVSDATGSVKVIWFNQQYLTKVLSPGDEIYLSGKVSNDKYTLQLVNPVYEKVKQQDATHMARVVPIYSLTSNLTQKQIRFLIKEALALTALIEDYLPQQVIDQHKLEDFSEALSQVHFPQDQKSLDKAVDRLKFNELFLFQLQVQMSKIANTLENAVKIRFFEQETKKFVDNLPFELTDDQRKSAWKILEDLQQGRPMNRMLEGDVGSGKTVVAILAMLNVYLNKRQSAMIAPTAILAFQHYNKIIDFLKNQNMKIALFTRTQQLVNSKEVSEKTLIKQIKNGDVDIIIGTHSLIADRVTFYDLALAVIDEQHRFGVAQRKLLKDKSGDSKTSPHFLSMTATPIPRSLALTLYGDLDLSTIRTMPKGRKKVITRIVEDKKRQEVYDVIKDQIAEGRQVFVICPLIDPSDKLGVKAVTEEYDRLKKDIFPDLNIALIHGKLKANQKEQVMSDFLNKKFDILVATSVVEVGVDVPNASIMLIEGAQRFGLAQLHQFRGRVGRSIYQSYCYVITDNTSPKTNARLNALATAKDGFELAEYDLQFRGPGEIYGIKQSGWLDFKIAKLSDQVIIEKAKEAAAMVLAEKDDLQKYPLLKQKMDQFLSSIHLE